MSLLSPFLLPPKVDFILRPIRLKTPGLLLVVDCSLSSSALSSSSVRLPNNAGSLFLSATLIGTIVLLRLLVLLYRSSDDMIWELDDIGWAAPT